MATIALNLWKTQQWQQWQQWEQGTGNSRNETHLLVNSSGSCCEFEKKSQLEILFVGARIYVSTAL